MNHFMESIVGSLRAAVIVINRDMIVQVWNWRAEDLWGLREDETVGAHLLNLDSGMPTEQLKGIIRRVVFDGDPGEDVVLDAVNRRGRSVQLRVTVSPLLADAAEPTGALMLMERVETHRDEGTAPV